MSKSLPLFRDSFRHSHIQQAQQDCPKEMFRIQKIPEKDAEKKDHSLLPSTMKPMYCKNRNRKKNGQIQQ
ncbi:hypothetical protein [Galactobacillus timonensis]|uniref:hypothetical protein n=1 Tax=Galactobacillus timonensis TaxID=2041840 RepID=UPI00240A4353|nr:hypothetical protein [Galactobacillus timonensis]